MRDVLWLTEVDDQPAQVVAARSGTDPRSVAVRAMRARRALGSAYLSEHVAIVSPETSVDRTCSDARPYLAGVVRDTVGIRRRRRVEQHLRDCEACTGAHAALRRLNRHLRSAATPASLLAAIKEHVLAWLTASTAPIAAGAMVAASVVAPATMLTIHDQAATSRRVSETSELVPRSEAAIVAPVRAQPDEPGGETEGAPDAAVATAATHASPSAFERGAATSADGSATPERPAAAVPAPVTTTAQLPPTVDASDVDGDGDGDHDDAADADDAAQDRDDDADDRPATVTCATVTRRGSRCSAATSDADDVQSGDADDAADGDHDADDADDHDADDADDAADDHDADDADDDHDADDADDADDDHDADDQTRTGGRVQATADDPSPTVVSVAWSADQAPSPTASDPSATPALVEPT